MSSLRSLLSMVLMLSAGSAAADSRKAVGQVTLRIHDYARIDRFELQQAQRRASEMYRRIGVTIEWRPSIRPNEIGRGAPWSGQPSDITVIVITGSMATRLRVPADVAGYAPISRERGGRIAFVIGDRTRRIACDGGADHASVLAAVIAHEMAHLLMPQRSHSKNGVMQPQWNPVEFRDGWQRRFSADEAAAIQQMVSTLRVAAPRIAD